MNKLSQLLLLVFLLVSMSAQSRVWRVNVDYRMVGDLPAVESVNQIFINQDEFAEFEKIFAQKINKNAVRNCKLAVVKKLLRELNAFKKIAYGSTDHKEIKKTFKITRSDFVDDVVVEVYLQKKGKDLLVSRVIVSGHTQSSAAVVHCFESLLDESTFVDRWTKTGVLGLGVLGVVGYLREWHQPYAQRLTDWAFADKPLTVVRVDMQTISGQLCNQCENSHAVILEQDYFGLMALIYCRDSARKQDIKEGRQTGPYSFALEKQEKFADGANWFIKLFEQSTVMSFNKRFWRQFYIDGDFSKDLRLNKGQKISFVIPLSDLAEIWRMTGKRVTRDFDGSCIKNASMKTRLTNEWVKGELERYSPIRFFHDLVKRENRTWQKIKTQLGRDNVELLVVDDLPETQRRISSRYWNRDGHMPADPFGRRDEDLSGAQKDEIVKFFVGESSMSEFSDTKARWVNLDGTLGDDIN